MDLELNKDIAALVTGAASGLGAATARALAAKGVRVGLLDIDEARGAPIAQEIGGHFAKCDITNEASVIAALADCRQHHDVERILVNCAGIAPGQRTARRRDGGNIESHDMQAFRRCIEINLIGTFSVMSKSAAAMLMLDPLPPDQERGLIINTASIAAEDGQIGQVAYAASKGGVQAMTLPVARDLAREGIRAVSIMPGLFRTPMFEGFSQEATKSLENQVPFPSRLGDPKEFAKLVLHICENTMINGESIRLDAALRLAPK